MAPHAERRGWAGCCGIALTEAVEDYLKAVFALSTRDEPTTTSALAEQVGVAPPTVSAMLKRLAAHGLITRADDHRVELTDHGLLHALDVVRRHRLLEAFLATVLNVPWDEVHAEAEVLEHAVSQRLLDRIDAFLGHPTHDPHGDPIPSSCGPHVERWTLSLAQAAPGVRFLVERVSDRDGAALRYLGELGIRPGTVLEVVERAPFDGPLWVQIAGGGRHGLGTPLTEIVHGRTA
jgi:DtxR family transcriptional regulator, Mn-dependent transcriptional regulator